MIPRLHLITDDAVLSRWGFRSLARDLLDRGGPGVALHLRGPGLGGRLLFDLGRDLRGPAMESGALLLVNDRMDVTLALDLDGAHLGQRSLPPRTARELLGRGPVLGLSVHDEEEARGGEPGVVDFLMVGTLYPTGSHPGRVPVGPQKIQELGTGTLLPLVGIGGITPGRIGEVMACGAHGVAVRGGVWESPDPVESLGVYLSEIENHTPSGTQTEKEERKGPRGDHE